jgi:Ca2+-binding EF-hand superfamily protein
LGKVFLRFFPWPPDDGATARLPLLHIVGGVLHIVKPPACPRLLPPTVAAMDDGLFFLDKSGVTAYMKDVVTLLLENRPSAPIAFICRYFKSITQGGSSPLLRAYRYIQLAPPQQPSFVDNLVAAYLALDSRRGASNVSGAELLRLLRLLCASCPLDVSLPLLHQLGRSESEPVSFDEFSAVVRAGLLYEDLFARACALFAKFDPHGTGSVPRSVLELALRHCRSGAADAGALEAALKHERVREEKRGDAAPAAAVGASASAIGGGASLPPPPPPVAARAELHRLQREVQWEVARLSLFGAGGGSSGGSAACAAAGASHTFVTFDEFMQQLFAASLSAATT